MLVDVEYVGVVEKAKDLEGIKYSQSGAREKEEVGLFLLALILSKLFTSSPSIDSCTSLLLLHPSSY